ncbi:hypothetical protein [Glutamicibacter arilaitensis]|uniref:hypothetical protein n=1 Tax=Glutamicibacter arilaitensis TaxID=256701 RepID=UPI00384CC8E5
MLKYLGLTKDATDSNETLPSWLGVTKKKRVIACAVSIALALAMFFLTRWLLADVQEGSFVKYVPGMFGAFTLLLSIVISERSLVRVKDAPEHHKNE